MISVFLVFFAMTGNVDVMTMNAFDRAKWCNSMQNTLDMSEAQKRILAPVPTYRVDEIRNWLQVKGAVLPPPSGFFAVPSVKININQIRREKKKTPEPLDLFLAAPALTDPAKNAVMLDILTRGCLIKALLNRKTEVSVPMLLLNASFHPPTMIFRNMIATGLQKMGPITVLSLYEYSRQSVNRQRNKELFYKVRFAEYVINSSASGNPRFALQSEKSLRLKLIALYGENLSSQAIEPLLEIANSEDIEYRKAGRDAILKYFDSKKKSATVGTIKLPGGEEKKAVLYISPKARAFHAVKQKLEELTKGDYDRTASGRGLAINLFSEWDKRRNSKWKYAFADAWELDKNGQKEQAVEKYREILANAPDLPQRKLMVGAFLELARQHLGKGSIAKALNLFRIVIQIDPKPIYEADLFYLLGLMEESSGDTEQARFWYRMSLRRNPEHIWSAGALSSLSPVPILPIGDWERSAFFFSAFLAFALFFIWSLRRLLSW
ncbi:tetratricopeptide repeat protein [Myxococcota bacterium]|nr:tetratricopeptide repeat protein [Myxococcota bacterium]MBU1380777.1 tetratricopeptide repeat protein [Myxococcota bacterium]MBU1498911.1 tetratricopeptide repeat protein [Myxococcota bacterium]